MTEKKNLTVYPWKRKVLLGICAASITLLMCELVLNLASYLSPFIAYQLSHPQERNTFSDQALGRRMSSYYPGHDSRGYRNQRSIDACEVLAIGDSWTYGFAAPPEGAWPRQLEMLSKKIVYNAGVGAYGPCEYEQVLNELLMLRPKTVVLGLYLGNDVGDAYKAVYIDGRCRHLKSEDEIVLNAIREADRRATLRELAEKFLPDRNHPRKGQASFSFRIWFSQHSSLYRLLQTGVDLFVTRSGFPFREGIDETFESVAKRPSRLVFNPPSLSQFRTVFRNPKHDALAVDLNDPRIREGLKITLSVIFSINAKLQGKGIQFIVILLHNKPTVYADLIQKSLPTFSEDFFRLVEMEEKVTSLIIKGLEDNRITYVETLPAFRACFLRGESPFPEGDDHHPSAVGYQAIAESILPILK